MHRVNRLWSHILQELLLLKQNHQNLQGNHIQQKNLDILYPLIGGPPLMESHLHIVWAHWHQRLLHFRGQILPEISKIGVCSCPRDANESHRGETKGAKIKSRRGCYFSVSIMYLQVLFQDLKCISAQWSKLSSLCAYHIIKVCLSQDWVGRQWIEQVIIQLVKLKQLLFTLLWLKLTSQGVKQIGWFRCGQGKIVLIRFSSLKFWLSQGRQPSFVLF